MAPSTPPPPKSDELAALTIASTSSVVMSATTMSRCVVPISAVSKVIDATLSPVLGICLRLEIQAARYADIVVMRVEESARGTAPVISQHLEEVVIGVEPDAGVERLGRALERDPMEIDPPVLARLCSARQFAFVDQLPDEGKPTQFRHQRRIERDLVDPRQNLRIGLRYFLALERINLHEQKALGRRGSDQGIKRWIADIAAVPIGHAVDFDRAKQIRQARRGDDHVGGHFLAREYAQLASDHVGGRDEKLQVGAGAHRVEVDEAFD